MLPSILNVTDQFIQTLDHLHVYGDITDACQVQHSETQSIEYVAYCLPVLIMHHSLDHKSIAFWETCNKEGVSCLTLSKVSRCGSALRTQRQGGMHVA